MVQNTIETGDVDQYTQNVSSVLSTVQTASSALSSVVTSLTRPCRWAPKAPTAPTQPNQQAISPAGAGNPVERGRRRQTLPTGLIPVWRDQHQRLPTRGFVVPVRLHLQRQQRYKLGGRSATRPSVQVNLPGSQIFSNSSQQCAGSLSSLVTALQSGNSSAIETATNAVDSALNYVSQQQVFYGNAENQLNSQETYLQQDTVTLASQENNLIGVNEAVAATDLSQAETDNSAALAAAAKVLPNRRSDE
jgi:flagellar hook-associated protein 3 FlgL